MKVNISQKKQPKAELYSILVKNVPAVRNFMILFFILYISIYLNNMLITPDSLNIETVNYISYIKSNITSIFSNDVFEKYPELKKIVMYVPDDKSNENVIISGDYVIINKNFINEENKDSLNKLIDELLILNTQDSNKVKNESLKNALELYISNKLKNKHKEDYEYISSLMTAYINLFVSNKQKKEVLFFIALCAIESNFDQTATRNPNTAPIGISQVIWKWHKNTIMSENISYEEFFNNPEDNIRGGFQVFKKHLNGAGGDYKLACKYYSGNTPGYYDKVNKEYTRLVSVIKKEDPGFFK
jgi:hypothetical protein